MFGRPGAGKTVLLHYIFGQLTQTKGRVPALFTLRRSGVTDELLKFVEYVVKRKLTVRSGAAFVLLVDGYDEVTATERRAVSEALREYQSLQLGPFFMTCRSYYPIDDPGADYFEIAPFTPQDAREFLVAFAKAYGASVDAEQLLSELSDRGFEDFAAHPLMLALICILRAGPLRALPRTSIGLLRRAVDTLTFRWDESKGIARDSKIPLDGDDRVRCMMSVAFVMKRYFESDIIVQRVTADYLRLQQRNDIPSERLLDEIAQWYGMLIPVADEQWTFAHRTIHDYLAARHWVESGTFASSRVTTWNARAAYAACLLPDATGSIVRALAASADIAAFVECLYNNARFNVEDVSAAILDHLVKYGGYWCINDGTSIAVEMKNDSIVWRRPSCCLHSQLRRCVNRAR